MRKRTIGEPAPRVVAIGLTALILTWTAWGQARAKQWQLRFEGQHVFEEHTGLTALPDETHEHVFVSSTMHHFWLVLPYSESWLLETGKKLPLDARDDRYTVSVRVVPREEESDEEFLRGVLAELAQGGRRRTHDATFFELHDRSILRVKSRGTEAAWTWMYHVVSPRGNRWYLLQFALEKDDEVERETEERILDILGAGFGADFEID